MDLVAAIKQLPATCAGQSLSGAVQETQTRKVLDINDIRYYTENRITIFDIRG